MTKVSHSAYSGPDEGTAVAYLHGDPILVSSLLLTHDAHATYAHTAVYVNGLVSVCLPVTSRGAGAIYSAGAPDMCPPLMRVGRASLAYQTSLHGRLEVRTV